jgi:hypothetical protein
LEEHDGWFYSVGQMPAYPEATIDANDPPEHTLRIERGDPAVAKRREKRASRLRTVVGAVLIVPAAIVGFVGASDIDRVSAAHRAATLARRAASASVALTTLRREEPKAAAARVVEPRLPEPPAAIPAPTVAVAAAVANVPVEKPATVRPAKKKRRRVAPQPVATTAPASEPVAAPDEAVSPPPDVMSDIPQGTNRELEDALGSLDR